MNVNVHTRWLVVADTVAVYVPAQFTDAGLLPVHSVGLDASEHEDAFVDEYVSTIDPPVEESVLELIVSDAAGAGGGVIGVVVVVVPGGDVLCAPLSLNVTLC